MKVCGRPPAATSGRPPSPALAALPAASFPLTPSACASCRSTMNQPAEHRMEHSQGGRISSSGWAWAHGRANGAAGRPMAARARVPLPHQCRRDGPDGTRAAKGREAGGRISLLWRLWMIQHVLHVSVVFCGSESSVHAVGCVWSMVPRTAVLCVAHVSLLRSIQACIYWYIGITKGTRRVVSVSATF